jgi:Type IV leader peptidase family
MVETTIVIPLIAGWVGGWVVNYLADVLPVTRRFSQPTCAQCGSNHRWQDYLLFRACKSCGKRRTIRTWMVQLFLVAMSITIWISPPARLGFALGILVLSYFTMDFVIDLEHRLILHPTSIFGAILGLGVGILRQGLGATLIGGAVGFGIVFLFYLFGALFTRIRSRRLQSAGLDADEEEAFGTGDVILATILGFMLGWPLIWFGILFGVLLGGVIGALVMLVLFLSRRFKSWMVFMPFGPFFITSAFLILYLPQFVKFLVPK